MWALMLFSLTAGAAPVSPSGFEIRGLLSLGDRLKSRSSHQSSSVTCVTPESWNHFLLPNGTKKWTFGCFALIFMIVGWSM